MSRALFQSTTTATAISSTTSTRHTTPTNMPKLRDSCVACASSKVRCHRQKPSCSRCMKRGITCEYVTSKRGGRNPASRSETTTETIVSPVVTLESPQLSNSPVDWFGSSPCGKDFSKTPPTISVSALNTLLDPFLSLEPSPSMGFDGLENDLDRFLASAAPFYPVEPEKNLDIHLGDPGDLDPNAFSMVINSNCMNSLSEHVPGSDDVVTPALLSTSNSRSSVSPASSQLPLPAFGSDILPLEKYELEGTTDSPCGCLLCATNLLRQLFTQPPTISPAHNAGSKASLSYHIQDIIARNKVVIDTVNTILQCHFSHDSYLLVMLSMILLKVLDTYADAAQSTRPWTPSTAPTGTVTPTGSGSSSVSKHGNTEDKIHARQRSYSSQSPSRHTERERSVYGGMGPESGAQSARGSLQLVLGELHRPQRLVNQLSDILMEVAAKRNMYETGSNPHGSNHPSPGKAFVTGGNYSPGSLFSDIILRQLGLDLKRRLQRLSLEIIEALKRE